MFYIFCKVHFWQSVLYGNVRVLQMFSTEVYLLEFFFFFLGRECSIISPQVFCLQMSKVNMFEFVLMAIQSWAQIFRNGLWDKKT